MKYQVVPGLQRSGGTDAAPLALTTAWVKLTAVQFAALVGLVLGAGASHRVTRQAAVLQQSSQAPGPPAVSPPRASIVMKEPGIPEPRRSMVDLAQVIKGLRAARG